MKLNQLNITPAQTNTLLSFTFLFEVLPSCKSINENGNRIQREQQQIRVGMAIVIS